MTISFIVTTFDIAPYVKQCLDSMVPCLAGGDQIVVVDDGSTDDTLSIIETTLAEAGLQEDVTVTLVPLGSNTMGGVGIPGNIGMDHAICDTVFFVDGDDFLDPAAFSRVRKEYEKSRPDILICNYLEYDQKAAKTKTPADQYRWEAIGAASPEGGAEDIDQLRATALTLIAVPWRKFYDRQFLVDNNLRFPEGDFFFEDNPFHWDVCRLARSVAFSNTVICYHRINRPGQTMNSTGVELLAFFTHYQTITSRIPQHRTDLLTQAARWLIGNMSWHFGRLKPHVLFEYCQTAASTLANIGDSIWNDALKPEYAGRTIWKICDGLRAGDVWGVIDQIKTDQQRDRVDRLERKADALAKKVDELSRRNDAINRKVDEVLASVKVCRSTLDAQKYIALFEELKDLSASYDAAS
jgi:glycosyltransferase involved in cell wall biosynthesis